MLAFLLTGCVSQGILVLCYHDLQPIARNEMTNTPANFESHLRWLKERGYVTLSIDDLVQIMKGRQQCPPKAIALTFDDGYEGVYRYAYPSLKKYGFKATLFLVTSSMGDQAPPMPHLTWLQIEEMDRTGVIRAEVHASRLHIKLGKRLEEETRKGKRPDDVREDLKSARSEIESHVHRRVSFVAWPYGDYNTSLIRMASGLGFYAMLNTEYGLNHPGDSVAKIKRLRMSSQYDTLERFKHKLGQYGLK